jgi:hypothetical protein
MQCPDDKQHADLTALLQRLPKDSVVRLIGQGTLCGQRPRSVQPLVSVLTRAGRERGPEREAAARLLGLVPADERERYAAALVLSSIVQNARPEPPTARWVRAAGWTAIATILALPLMYLVSQYIFFGDGLNLRSPAIPQGTSPAEAARVWADFTRERNAEMMRRNTVSNIAMLNLWISMVAVATVWSQYAERRRYGRANRLRAAAATALGALREPESVGSLLVGLYDRNREVRQASEHALSAILPLLEERHDDCLTPSSLAALARASAHENPTFALEAVRALGVVGSKDAIPAVERAAASGATEEIRTAAGTALQLLRQRAAHESQRATLLRPGHHDAPAGELLRPAAGAEATPQQQLLRATGTQEEGAVG